MENKIDFTGMNIKERVLYVADKKEKNKSIFFKKLGFFHSNFSGIALQRKLNQKSIFKITRTYPDVNFEWLISGKGKPFFEMSTNEYIKNAAEISSYLNKLLSKVEKLSNPFKEILEIIPTDRKQEYLDRYKGLIDLPDYIVNHRAIADDIELLLRNKNPEYLLNSAYYITETAYNLIRDISYRQNNCRSFRKEITNPEHIKIQTTLTDQICIDFLKKTGKYNIYKITETAI